jgi:hypothetical protein
MLHCGIPSLISSKMPTVLFGGGFKVIATVYNDDETINEAQTKQAQELVNNLVTITDMAERLENQAENESWGGHIFSKLSHDVPLSNYPIYETADIRKAEAIKERGITTAIKFKYWYKYNNNEYRLDETYTNNDDGDAIIKYELYKMDSDGNDKQVDLEDIPQTEYLRYTDEKKTTRRLNNNDEFVYKGLKCKLAFDKPNKTPSHEFMDSYYGASDYEGAIDSFDALDEAYTEISNELRANKTKRYIPESMIPKRAITDSRTGEQRIESLLPDEFTDNYVKVTGDIDQDAQNKIDIQQISDKTEVHLKKFRVALTTAINKAGLSPLALGITGLESVNASAESQQERNKATLETRARKLRIWRPYIEDVMMSMLLLNAWMQKETSAKQDAFAKLDLNFENLDIRVEFNDYIIENISNKIATWGNAKQTGVASIEEAVKNIHDDWEDVDIDKEVNLIRFENGMSLDNPNNLPNLTGTEDDTEEENEDM